MPLSSSDGLANQAKNTQIICDPPLKIVGIYRSLAMAIRNPNSAIGI
jgi:hypothetical protein